MNLREIGFYFDTHWGNGIYLVFNMFLLNSGDKTDFAQFLD